MFIIPLIFWVCSDNRVNWTITIFFLFIKTIFLFIKKNTISIDSITDKYSIAIYVYLSN